MKNVLVTGGAGFIGSNFVRFLLQAEPDVRVINLDMLSYAGSQENLMDLPAPDRHTFIRGDICDRPLVDHLFHKNEIDTVIHFAAETHVDRSILHPEDFLRTNVVGTFTLLEAARQYWLAERALPPEELRFHHISTDEVYGTLKPGEPAWTESAPYAPTSPYSASKAASDHYVRAYGHTYGLPYSITNCSNNYGPYQFPEKLIPLMILNALDGKPLPVYGDGGQVRDWLYVEDHCEAIWTILRKGQPGQTYNVGGGSQPTNLEVVRHLCGALDELLPGSPSVPHASLISFVPDRPGHDRRYAIDITRIKTQLGWEPRQSLGSGLQKTIQWYLSHPEWVSTIRQQVDYQHWLVRNYEKRQ
ncbi:MAG: dTDP-glucose 4,6-dehydratase [Chloroflexi bacterium RBG_16_54_11]|nr:MAG: dTDP-glucose 4,6-dehydratase [Chloroflexi bacterium RBG_16_54_11]